MSSNANKKKRQSEPSCSNPQGTSSAPSTWNGWGPPPMFAGYPFNPYYNQGMSPMGPHQPQHPQHHSSISPSGAATRNSQTGDAPWKASSSSGTSDEDDDFKQPTRKKRSSNAAASKPAKAGKSGAGEKRKRGRPSKGPQTTGFYPAELPELIRKYPKRFSDEPAEIALLEKDQCAKCTVYKGEVCLKPCGHAKFCFRCIEELREKAVNMMRPARCLHSNCYQVVRSWIKMFNVSA